MMRPDPTAKDSRRRRLFFEIYRPDTSFSLAGCSLLNDADTFNIMFDESFDSVDHRYVAVIHKSTLKRKSKPRRSKGILWVRDLVVNEDVDGVALVCDGAIVDYVAWGTNGNGPSGHLHRTAVAFRVWSGLDDFIELAPQDLGGGYTSPGLRPGDSMGRSDNPNDPDWVFFGSVNSRGPTPSSKNLRHVYFPIINEVLYWPRPGSRFSNKRRVFIEIFRNDTSYSLYGCTLINHDGSFRVDFDELFDSVSHPYITVKRKRTLETEFKLSRRKGVLWMRDMVLEKIDALGLFCDGRLIDYVAWGHTGDFWNETLHNNAVASGIWSGTDEYVEIAELKKGDSIGRNAESRDTNDVFDWIHQEATPSRKNSPPILSDEELLELCRSKLIELSTDPGRLTAAVPNFLLESPLIQQPAAGERLEPGDHDISLLRDGKAVCIIPTVVTLDLDSGVSPEVNYVSAGEDGESPMQGELPVLQIGPLVDELGNPLTAKVFVDDYPIDGLDLSEAAEIFAEPGFHVTIINFTDTFGRNATFVESEWFQEGVLGLAPTSSPSSRRYLLTGPQPPAASPTASPTDSPTNSPTDSPAASPTSLPSKSPTPSPTHFEVPTFAPSFAPYSMPSGDPPTGPPSNAPSSSPSEAPTANASTGTIKGVVFRDEKDKPGIKLVVVKITGPNGFSQTVITDEKGEYMVVVPEGKYVVTIDESTVFPGGQQTAGSNPTELEVRANVPAIDRDGFLPYRYPVGIGVNDGCHCIPKKKNQSSKDCKSSNPPTGRDKDGTENYKCSKQKLQPLHVEVNDYTGAKDTHFASDNGFSIDEFEIVCYTVSNAGKTPVPDCKTCCPDPVLILTVNAQIDKLQAHASDLTDKAYLSVKLTGSGIGGSYSVNNAVASGYEARSLVKGVTVGASAGVKESKVEASLSASVAITESYGGKDTTTVPAKPVGPTFITSWITTFCSKKHTLDVSFETKVVADIDWYEQPWLLGTSPIFLYDEAWTNLVDKANIYYDNFEFRCDGKTPEVGGAGGN